MKTIRRIGLFLLAAVLCTFFSGCVPLGRMAVERMEESIMDYKDAMTFAAGNFTYAASEVRRVSVSWVGGSVKLEKGAGDTLRADESGMLSVPQQMHWRIKDGTLEIMYCASGYAGRFPLDAKALTLEIPAGADVTVRSVSAPVRGDALSVGDLTVSTVSGAIGLADVTAADLRFGSTSGRIDLAGETRADALHADTVSGAVDAEQLAAAADVDIDTTSGAVRLTVPTTIGATFCYKTVSGILHCDDYRVKGGTSVFGEGGCTAAVSTVSGSLTVTDR